MMISALKARLTLDSRKKNEYKDLEALLDEDPSQIQEDLAESLGGGGGNQQIIFVRLKFVKIIQSKEIGCLMN